MTKTTNQYIHPDELIGIDVFSGSGGLSLGAEMAGIKVKYAVEIWDSAALTYKRNHPNTIVFNKNIEDINPQKDISSKHKHIFIIMGGPPCQGFSMSNQSKEENGRNMDNPKNLLFKEFVRFVDVLRPDWFLFENVEGIIRMEHGDTIKRIASSFKELGYHITEPTVLWANDYGVPQKRNRCFIVGNKLGIDFQFPKVMNSNVSVSDAIDDLPILHNGDNIKEAPYKLSINKCSEYAKLMRKGSKVSTQNLVSLNNDLVIKRYSYIPQRGDIM